MSMTFNVYQEKAMSTCMDSCHNLAYMLIGLQGEVGELSSKIAKLIRQRRLFFDANNIKNAIEQEFHEVSEDEYRAILAEIGDCQWFLAGLCDVLNTQLGDVAQGNLDKLSSRKKRGVIDGDGDKR